MSDQGAFLRAQVFDQLAYVFDQVCHTIVFGILWFIGEIEAA